mgnify:FL=1
MYRQRRGGTRESTPDSYIRSMEAPGSTSRSRHPHRGVVGGQSRSLSAPPFDRAHEAPSSSEIEAFFQGAEQQERRKFIKRCAHLCVCVYMPMKIYIDLV